MEIRTQVFTRYVVQLENRDLLVDPSGVVKPTTWRCTRPGRWLGREPYFDAAATPVRDLGDLAWWTRLTPVLGYSGRTATLSM
jgi:hypothetical protein